MRWTWLSGRRNYLCPRVLLGGHLNLFELDVPENLTFLRPLEQEGAASFALWITTEAVLPQLPSGRWRTGPVLMTHLRIGRGQEGAERPLSFWWRIFARTER